jgi:hypothetical protein
MIRTLLVALLLTSTPAIAENWYEHYEKGVRLIEQGKGEAAKEALDAALAARGAEGCRFRRARSNTSTTCRTFISPLPAK